MTISAAQKDLRGKGDQGVAGPHGCKLLQGILKGEVPLYHIPPVCLVLNQLYDN